MAAPITAVLTIAVSAFTAFVNAWTKMLELMTPEQRIAYFDIFIENLAWWQENVWRKLGNLLDGD